MINEGKCGPLGQQDYISRSHILVVCPYSIRPKLSVALKCHFLCHALKFPLLFIAVPHANMKHTI